VNPGVLTLRRRCGWEACDSGVLLWRRNFLPLLLFPGIPILALASPSWFFSDLPLFVPCLALWWLKPLWERLALHVVSLRFFEPDSSLRRLFPGLRRTAFRGLPGDLLWRRFSPWRAARLAVRVLETAKAAGKKSRQNYRQRISSLSGGGLGFCVFLTVFGIALEIVTFTGEAVFCLFVWQMFGPPLYQEMPELFERFAPFFLTLYGMNLALLESLYVCMGFGLYIRSRVEVEGWDIQLLLQKAASSAAARNSTPRTLLAVAALFCLLPASKLFPEGAGPPAGTQAAPLEELGEVFASPDFGQWREIWRIRGRGGQDGEARQTRDQPTYLSRLAAWNGKTKEFLAHALRFTLVAAIAGFGLFSVYRLSRMEKKPPARKNGRFYGEPPPSPDKPRELLRGARDLYGQGRVREAWALCFRAARAAYGVSRGLAFPSGATAYGCLSLAQEAGCDASGGFARLVRGWISCAYAGRLPPGEAFEEALGFCHSLLGEEASGA
jgi:hypothetical protein